MLIYVVEGSTGEYEDRREWLVKTFKDEEKAKEFASKCNKEADRIEAESDYWEYREAVHALDPSYNRDYTGTRYTYFSVEMEE